MTRCPNCGSAVRIGAKFCTSCGFRLAVDETASTPAQTVAPSRSPFATTSSPVWRAEPDPVEASPAAAEAEPVVEAPWSASSADDEEREETAVGTLPSDPVADGDHGDAKVEEVQAASPVDDNDGPGRSWFVPAPPDTSGPVSDDMIASLDLDGEAPADQPAVDVVDDADGSIEPTATASSAATTADDRELIFVSSVGRSTGRESTPTPTSVEPVSSVSSATATEWPDDALGEARSLVARLSDLLGSSALAGGGSTAGEAGNSPWRPSLDSIADQSDVDALRAVVASAQERPRDVDVMLDLVLRAETIAAVIADRDLLLAALRGDEAAVEESWSTPAEHDEPSTYPAWGTP